MLSVPVRSRLSVCRDIECTPSSDVLAFEVDILGDSRKTPLNDAQPLIQVPCMSQNPMPQPDPYGTSSPWDEESGDTESPGRVGDVVSAGDPRDVAEVARALAVHGGGEASFELALDLVLHQVVEEARVATGATGAAIALARAGEMVCRATSGPDAPDLGVRLETNSGLSGACLQTGMIQQCGDTETDPRVDAEACRRLGVRSILVLPLGDGPEPFGILEVFSSLLDAFGDQDVSTLKNLARRVVADQAASNAAEKAANNVANKIDAEPVVPVLPRVDDKSLAPEIAPAIEVKTPPEAESMAEAAAPPAEEGFRRGHDLWTAILGILVILTAVVLGLALGWRGAIVRGLHGGSTGSLNAGSQARTSPSPVEKSAEQADGGSDSGTEQAVAPSRDAASPIQSGSQLQQGSSRAASSVEPPSGGLVVTQNGKVIYRLAPGEPGAGARSVPESHATRNGAGRPVSAEVSATRLIHRVEPQYPEEARTQHIQGLVTLDIQIGGEGAVHNITVVEGNPLLAEAAAQAVRQWRYQPYSEHGRPAEMQTRITIRFTLPPT